MYIKQCTTLKQFLHSQTLLFNWMRIEYILHYTKQQ